MTSGIIQRGHQLGQYALLERIGVGGEGAVWSAWDNRKHRVVAIKLILVADRGDAALASLLSAEFERQVHLIASFEHPHILPLYEFGTTEDYFYFVMQYAPFGSLASTLRRGPLPVPDVVRMTAQIVSALSYLHARGVIYRDLKPSNILLDAKGRPYLSDFGLARRLSQETRVFHTGRGTGPYAPYEQHTRSGLYVESDVFSLGIMLYEMFSGQLPWEGEFFLAMQQQQEQEGLPDIRLANRYLPDTLNRALRRLTAFRWRDRPRTMLEAFEEVLSALPDCNNALTRLLLHAGQLPAAADVTVLNATGLLSRFPPDWEGAEVYSSRLSHLALIDAAATHPYRPRLALTPLRHHFLLRGALVHDFHLEHWWQQADDPSLRLAACTQTILYEEETAVARALAKLRTEPELLGRETLPESVYLRLVEVAATHRQWQVRNDALDVLEHALPAASDWRPACLSPAADVQLADLAALDTAQGRQAARLIGRVRSETAVRHLLANSTRLGENNVRSALQIIYETAGGLPAAVPLAIRLPLLLAQWRERLLVDPEGLSWTRAAIGALVGGLVGLLMLAGFFAQPNMQMRDILLAPYPVSDIVTIVEISDETLATFGRWDAWPRTLHADLIARLDEAGASVIVFDVIFSESTAEDAALIAAMERAGNVVQPVLGQGDGFRDAPGAIRYEEWVLPQREIAAAVGGLGHTNVLHDVDGIVRRLPTFITVGEERYPSLALTALQLHLAGADAVDAFPRPADGTLAFAGRQIPVSESGEIELYFAGPPATLGRETFRTVAYEDVLAGTAPREAIADKIILIGVTATAEPDRYLTAVSGGRPMYGVEIMANAVEAIWSAKYIHHPGRPVALLLLLLLGALAGLTAYRPWLGLFLATGLGISYFMVANLLFEFRAVALDLFYPFLAIGFSYVTVTAYRYSLETRRRRRVMQLFASSVTPDVAQATVAAVQRGEINLRGQSREVTVLNVHIRGYKAYARYDEPEAVIAMLGTYRDMIVTAVHQNEGAITHAEGGQVTALFNAPLPQADHIKRAVLSALAARTLVQARHAALSDDHPERLIHFGYGIHSGRAIVGELGGDRERYTALGDTVSIAVELSAQADPDQILVGDPVSQAAGADFVVERVAPLLVHASSVPIPAYNVKAGQG